MATTAAPKKTTEAASGDDAVDALRMARAGFRLDWEAAQADRPAGRSPTLSLAAGGIAGILASVCCVGPLVLVLAGIGGAWVSTLVAFEPYRLYFLTAAAIALGFAWRRIYRPAAECAPGEVCAIRDDKAALDNVDAKVVVITNYPRPANAEWAKQLSVDFPILSDYWPHGAVATAYGSFNDTFGVTMRWSFVLDKDGVVREIIKTDSLPEAREHAAYQRALSAIG